MVANNSQAAKSRLKALDDLYRFGGEANHPAATPVAANVGQASKEYMMIEFCLMDSYPNHRFRLYEGIRKEYMTESIRRHGILQPLILHAKSDGRFTILSGHNRKDCGIDAGLDSGPAIIKFNLTEVEEKVYVYETNLMQRSFADMLPSEKAAVLAEYHAEMFSQGKRNDILAEIQSLANPPDTRDYSTSVEFRRSPGTRETLAVEYGLTPNRVAQYLRVNKLIGPLSIRLDKGEFTLSPAANLSFLKATEQKAVDKCMKLNGFKVDMRKSDILREYSDTRKLDDETVYYILNGEIGRLPKKNRTPTIKVAKSVYTKYFQPEQSVKEVQRIVEKAICYYFSHIQEQEILATAINTDQYCYPSYDDEDSFEFEP